MLLDMVEEVRWRWKKELKFRSKFIAAFQAIKINVSKSRKVGYCAVLFASNKIQYLKRNKAASIAMIYLKWWSIYSENAISASLLTLSLCAGSTLWALRSLQSIQLEHCGQKIIIQRSQESIFSRKINKKIHLIP